MRLDKLKKANSDTVKSQFKTPENCQIRRTDKAVKTDFSTKWPFKRFQIQAVSSDFGEKLRIPPRRCDSWWS